MTSSTQEAFAHTPHDHQHCIESALRHAEAICKRNDSRLTTIRRRVLELIWQSHQPLGAYEILAQFAAEGKNSAPPTVYRALDFLLENGLIHRLATLNAYAGCSQPEKHHNGAFLICRRCKNVAEITHSALDQVLHESAQAAGFVAETSIVEIAGLCPQCEKTP